MSAQFEFRCMAFHEGLAHGRAPGRLYVDQDCIEFVVGENSGNMSLHGLQLQTGGMTNRKIILTHPIWRGWAFETSRRALLQNPFLRSHPAIGFQIDDIRRKSRFGMICWFLVLIVITLTALFLVTRIDAVTDRLSQHVPPAWESTLGRLALERYLRTHTILDNAQTAPLLQPFSAPLLGSIPESTSHEFVFHLTVDESPFAFALPGGAIIIHTGFIESAESAEILMALLAHEISHVTQKHSVRSLLANSGLPILIGAILGDKAGYSGTGAAVARHLLDPRYSQRFETEADVHAYNLLKRARLTTAGLHDLFESLAIAERHAGSTYIAAHPAGQQRLEHLQSLSDEAVDEETRRALAIEFELLRQRVNELTVQAGLQQGPPDAG